MKKLKISIILLYILTGVKFANATPSNNIDDYKILTSSYYNFNFLINKTLKGISSDLLSEILKDIGSQKTLDTIEVRNWSDIYKELEENNNIMIFSATKIPEIEHLYKWVGPISKAKNIIIAKRSSNLKINELEDINSFVTAVEADSSNDFMLRKYVQNQKKILRVSIIEDLMTALNEDKVDLVSIEKNSFLAELKRLNLKNEDYVTVYSFEDHELYYAFSLGTPDSLIEAMQSSLDKIKNSSKYQDIIKNYKLVSLD